MTLNRSPSLTRLTDPSPGYSVDSYQWVTLLRDISFEPKFLFLRQDLTLYTILVWNSLCSLSWPWNSQ